MLKKRVSLVLLVAPLVLPAGCSTPESRPEELAPLLDEGPTPTNATVSSELVHGLKLELSIPKVHFQPGDTVIATLSSINTTQNAISFETQTSQLFDLIIEAPGRERRWSEAKVFLTVITSREIPPNETLSDVLSFKTNLSPGDFYLTGLTVPFELNGERIRLETTPVKITVQ